MSDHRERILACACDLYLRDGLDGLSMRKLAKVLGVTAPAIYRHYDGREEVLADILREAHRTFSRYMYQALGAPTPIERLSGASDGYLDFVFEHPRWYEMLFILPEHLGMDTIPKDIEAMACAIQQFWIDRVRECMEAGILQDGDARETSVTMWAHAHGLVQLYHQGRFPLGHEEFRVLFRASGARVMAGIATKEYAVQLTRKVTEEAAQLSS